MNPHTEGDTYITSKGNISYGVAVKALTLCTFSRVLD